jgi:hypothetical protein
MICTPEVPGHGCHLRGPCVALVDRNELTLPTPHSHSHRNQRVLLAWYPISAECVAGRICHACDVLRWRHSQRQRRSRGQRWSKVSSSNSSSSFISTPRLRPNMPRGEHHRSYSAGDAADALARQQDAPDETVVNLWPTDDEMHAAIQGGTETNGVGSLSRTHPPTHAPTHSTTHAPTDASTHPDPL